MNSTCGVVGDVHLERIHRVNRGDVETLAALQGGTKLPHLTVALTKSNHSVLEGNN